MKKAITFLLLIVINFSFAQKTSKEEINKIIKEQSDGVYNNTASATKTVYSDGKEAISTVYKDAKSLSPKIAQGINEIAKGLKIGAESVWNILVKQQKVWSICFLILTIASLMNWFIFYKRYLSKKIESDFIKGKRDLYESVINPDYDSYYYGKETFKDNVKSKKILSEKVGEEDILIPIENNNNIYFKYAHFLICITMSIFSFYHFGAMLTGFLNPEYGAMKDILFVALKLK